MARENVILPHKIYRSMRNLSDAECGRLFRALLLYSMGEGEQIKLQGRETGLFDVYSQEIDDDIAAYERKCETNKANRAQSSPVVTSRYQSSPVVTDGIQSSHNNNNNNNNNINNNNKDNNNDNQKGRETRARARFTPPTVEEVADYAAQMRYTGFGAERFVDYYASKGWLVGKSPMKDWRAAVRGWYSRDQGENAPVQAKNNPALDYAQRDSSYYEDFEYFDLDKYGGAP